MKIKSLITITSLLISLHSYCQCDASLLLKRQDDKYKNNNDKIMNIRLTVGNDRSIIREINSDITRMKQYIKISLQQRQKPDISKYISNLDFTKKEFSTFKINETEKLDNLVYCFIVFLRAKYSKIQQAISITNNVKGLAVKIESIYEEINSEGITKLTAIDKEMRYLGAKFIIK